MIIILIVLFIVAAYVIVQAVRCSRARKVGELRLEGYGAKTVGTSFGAMSYVDSDDLAADDLNGKDVILSVHGIFGGYDQAFDTCRDFLGDYRVIAPSRFGYPGSDLPGGGAQASGAHGAGGEAGAAAEGIAAYAKACVADQADAYVELLDKLGIDKVYVLATSAGGSVAIRFALDYPERTKGLILYCSAMPLPEEPEKFMEYAGPPAFFCSDFMMFLINPLFGPIMGMDASVIYDMVPIADRKAGVIHDASVTNPDMARNFERYEIEALKVPTLILHAKDDKLAKFAEVEAVVDRFPHCTFVAFEDGGHLMKGHGEEVRRAVKEFVGE